MFAGLIAAAIYSDLALTFRLQKLFVVTSATKGGWLPPPLDLALGSRYRIV